MNPDWRKLLPQAPDQAQLPVKNEEANREYFDKLRLELEALAVAKPENDRQIGEIPMSCSPPDRPFAKAV